MANKKQPIKQVAKALPKDLGVIQKIVKLYKRGYSKLEIVSAGFNKNTVYRQTRELVDLA